MPELCKHLFHLSNGETCVFRRSALQQTVVRSNRSPEQIPALWNFGARCLCTLCVRSQENCVGPVTQLIICIANHPHLHLNNMMNSFPQLTRKQVTSKTMRVWVFFLKTNMNYYEFYSIFASMETLKFE